MARVVVGRVGDQAPSEVLPAHARRAPATQGRDRRVVANLRRPSVWLFATHEVTHVPCSTTSGRISELDDELRAYVESVTAEKIKQGMTPDAARRAALLETGGVEQVKEEVRDIRPGVFLQTLLQDMRYAARTLRKAPVFSLAAVVTLAIGIGASTAIFSMVNGVLLHRLPIGSGDRLVHLVAPSAQAPDEGYSMIEVADLNRDLRTMSGVAEYHSMPFQLYGHGDPLRVQTGVVSDRFFDMIGVKPVLGRTFLPGEEAVGAPPVVVLSYQFWMDQFHGDSSIVGATFTMNDRMHHVVGVLPPLPGYPNENDMWMPAGACPFRSAPMMMNDRGMRMVRGVRRAQAGRLARARRRRSSRPSTRDTARRIPRRIRRRSGCGSSP